MKDTTREVVCITGSGVSYRIILCTLQIVTSAIISVHYLRSDRLREYVINALRSGSYRWYSKGEITVRPFSGRVTAVLSQRKNLCVWHSQGGELLTFSGNCRSWRTGDEFSFVWIEVPTLPTLDNRYDVDIVRVIFFPMNVYYFVLRDWEGNYAGSLWVVWHS